MEEYFRAKSRLFRGLEKGGPGDGCSAVINGDDPKGEELAALTDAEVVTYGLGGNYHIRADSISAGKTGLRAKLMTPLGERTIRSSLIGEFNIYNIMAASAAAISLNIDLDAVVEGIEGLKVVPGRLELVQNSQGLTVVVDYAHTPDALLKTLKALKAIVEGRSITIFGCGGDRDKGKRCEMGIVAGEHSDLVLITSDNPRSEDPLAIMAQIEKGIRKSGLSRMEGSSTDRFVETGYTMEVDRRKAIRRGVAMAHEKDLVLIAGKGHEDYQIIGDRKRSFDDRKEAALAASEVGH